MSTSQNGWPALSSGSSLLHYWAIGDRNIALRNGSAGFLLAHLALWFDNRIEDIEHGTMDDWGYAYRPVRGFVSGLSNHASGTAMDLNATQHVLGRTDTFTNDEEQKIRRRIHAVYDDAIRWGGSYQGRKDEMHWEINVPLHEAERVARSLLRTPRGRKILTDNPGQARVILS